MAFYILRVENGHEAAEPKSYDTEEEAVEAIQQRIFAAETQGGAGGPPEQGMPDWWVRTSGITVQYRIVIPATF
jgi:hypothetical protein